MDKYRKVKTIGRGSFGSAILVTKGERGRSREYVMKVISIRKMNRK